MDLSESNYTFMYNDKPHFKDVGSVDSKRYMNMNMFYNTDKI